MTFEYIIYERSRRTVLLHSLDYDVNIEKLKKFKKFKSFRGSFTPSDHTYKPLAEKSRGCKDSACQSMAILQIKADADFANSTLFDDKKPGIRKQNM